MLPGVGKRRACAAPPRVYAFDAQLKSDASTGPFRLRAQCLNSRARTTVPSAAIDLRRG
ncbi:hypothetical protein BUH_6012 [Burkholderia pseudomallei Pakistan 9]|nr:hypothetical protein BUH_6012 [Burkholderia pseudomallei Pakistan 9]EEP52275.1 hypothetical protein GBP346_B1010 [Burkholderia pseudomallei MSHR346]